MNCPSRSSSADSTAVSACTVMRMSKVCRPRPPVSRSAKRVRMVCENFVVTGDCFSQDCGARLFKNLADPFAARNFAGARYARHRR